MILLYDSIIIIAYFCDIKAGEVGFTKQSSMFVQKDITLDFITIRFIIATIFGISIFSVYIILTFFLV